jgi:hypothetical protein
MRVIVFIIMASLATPLAAPGVAFAQSSTIRLPQERMDVREALRLLRVATEHMEIGDYDRACSIYDHLLSQFETWWIPLAGRVRCGLKRSENIDKLANWVVLLRKFEAPSHVVERLHATVVYEQERLRLLAEAKRRAEQEKLDSGERVEQRPIPRPTPPKPAIPPNPNRFIKAWEDGNYRVVLEEAERFEHDQKLSSGVLRIAVESAFLLRNADAIDKYMPKLLIRTRNMPLLVRYLRNLQSRKERVAYERWYETWKRWNRGED